MADNVAVTAGSGTTIAADDIGGVLYPRKKLSLGADGSATDAVGGAGAVSAAVLRTTLASDDPAVTILTALQKAEDAAHSSGDKGVQLLTVRADTAAALSGTDGDYQPLVTGSDGTLHTKDANIVLLTKAEDAAHSSGDRGIQTLAVRKDTAAALAGTDGDYAPLEVDANGRLHVIDVSGVTLAAALKAEDAAHSSGDVGFVALARRIDTPASSSGTSGDYATIDTDAIGRVWVTDKHDVVSVTPTIDTNIFAAGDAVGGKQTFTSAALLSGGIAVLESLTVIDKGNQKPVIDIVFFDSDPTAATITNNASFVFSTDVSKVVARVSVAAADYQTIDSIAIAQVPPATLREIVLKASGSANLFAAVILRSGTPTFLSTTDLIFKYGIKQR